jgi:hypothetical protein
MMAKTERKAKKGGRNTLKHRDAAAGERPADSAVSETSEAVGSVGVAAVLPAAAQASGEEAADAGGGAAAAMADGAAEHAEPGQAAAAQEPAGSVAAETSSEGMSDGQEDRLHDHGQPDPAASGHGAAQAAVDPGVQAGDAEGDGAAAEAAEPVSQAEAIDITNSAAAEIYGKNVVRAAAAASWAFHEDFSEGADPSELLGTRAKTTALDAFAEAADFLRKHPDAAANALALHLRLKGFPSVPDPGPRELAAWKVFAFALQALDDVDAQLAAAAAGPAADPGTLPLTRAMKPRPGPFDPSSGMTSQR